MSAWRNLVKATHLQPPNDYVAPTRAYEAGVRRIPSACVRFGRLASALALVALICARGRADAPFPVTLELRTGSPTGLVSMGRESKLELLLRNTSDSDVKAHLQAKVSELDGHQEVISVDYTLPRRGTRTVAVPLGRRRVGPRRGRSAGPVIRPFLARGDGLACAAGGARRHSPILAARATGRRRLWPAAPAGRWHTLSTRRSAALRPACARIPAPALPGLGPARPGASPVQSL